jgi:prophage regulatory protein
MSEQARALTILRLRSVIARTGLSKSSIYAMVKQGKFIPPVSLGARAVGWIESDVDQWIVTHEVKTEGNGLGQCADGRRLRDDAKLAERREQFSGSGR